MANGQQIAAHNIKAFHAWVAERRAANDWVSYIRRDQINRTEIARECGFAVSVLRQNPVVKDALARLEQDLEKQGVLHPQEKEKTTAPEPQSLAGGSRDRQRLTQLEQQNHVLRAENDGLRAQLKRYGMLDEFLLVTGRLPR
jgi:hypothetical protein